MNERINNYLCRDVRYSCYVTTRGGAQGSLVHDSAFHLHSQKTYKSPYAGWWLHGSTIQELLQVQISTRSVRPMRGIDNNYPPYGRALIVVWDFNQFWFNSLGFQPGSITVSSSRSRTKEYVPSGKISMFLFLFKIQLSGGEKLVRVMTIGYDNRNNSRDLLSCTARIRRCSQFLISGVHKLVVWASVG